MVRHLKYHFWASLVQRCSTQDETLSAAFAKMRDINCMTAGETAFGVNQAAQLKQAQQMASSLDNLANVTIQKNSTIENLVATNATLTKAITDIQLSIAQMYAATSEVETKVILMGHPGLSCHVPVVRSIFILLIPKYRLEIFVRFTLLCMYYHTTNFLIITL
jgi:hypothetical protein